MMSDEIEDKARGLREAKNRAARLAGDFVSVFGQPDKRTAPQKNVLGHLNVCAGDDANSYRFNAATDGVALIAAGLHRDGARSLLRVIDRQLLIAKNQREEKPPVKSKR